MIVNLLLIIYPIILYLLSYNLVILVTSVVLSLLLFLLIQKIKRAKSVILDINAVYDARITDIINSNLFEHYILPKFVIKEIEEQTKNIKNKIVEKNLESIKKNKKVKVLYKNYFNLKSVEFKIIKLAKDLNAKIITTNFDLTKSGIIQNIKVIDINDLYERLKPIVLPGYSISIFLVKEGKERNQAIGFLEDGTTVVVEHAKSFIGKRVNVEITSSLHSSTNKMLFARLINENIMQEVI